jgi:tryptophan synthase alpha chain
VSPSRLAARFAARAGGTGLIPFVTAGYPSLDDTLAMLRAFDRAGALAVEVGVPFSEPIADGPDIQRASEHALRAGVSLPDVLDLVARFRRESELPVVLMTYTNPVVRMVAEAFATAARAAGVDGVIVSDLPPEELPEVWAALDAAALDTILLVAPTTAAERVPRLLARCRGFVYCLARTGVTGQGGGEGGPLPERIASLRAQTALPVAVGFGIASGADAARLRGLADAAIVGAAFMRRVAEDPGHGAVERVAALADELVAALR